MHEALTEATVRLAYKLILGRAEHDAAMLRHALGYATLDRLRNAFLNSREFEYILNLRPRLVPPGAPPLAVEWRADDASLLAMLRALGATWDSAPPPLADGARQAADLLACLRRNFLPDPAGAQACELGCGDGRLTRHLANHVGTLVACDASPGQLRRANEANMANVSLRLADDLRFGIAEPYDVLFSFHALHHGPPPLAARALSHALALLRPGGAAVVQLVTYASGYGYAAADTARPAPADPHDDKHVLPQPAVFAIAAAAGCVPLEVFDDVSVAPSVLWRSSVFVLHKPLP